MPKTRASQRRATSNFALSRSILCKRQEALQQGAKSRKKAEGKRQEAEMQIFSLFISPSAYPRLNWSLSALSYLFLLRIDRGFLIREKRSVPIAKSKETTAKKLYWGIGCGIFVCTVICQLQTDSRQLVASVGKKFALNPCVRSY